MCEYFSAKLKALPDKEINSLTNQRQILIDYIEKNGHPFARESFYDNVSGMTFDRDRIEEISQTSVEHKIDVVLVNLAERKFKQNIHRILKKP